MPTPKKAYEEAIARNEAADRAASNETVRDLVRTCGHLVFWVLAGWTFIGLSAYTTNIPFGWVLFWTGFAVWIPGVTFSLLAAYRRGEERGDW